MNFFGDFLQRTTVGVDAYEERVRFEARAIVDEETVAGANVNYNSFVRSDETLKRSAINLSDGFYRESEST